MGSYFRKSKSFGPIRLNFSKSGVGVSTGVTGARMVFSPKGTYVHLGRNGLYYKKHISVKGNSKNQDSQEFQEVPTTQIAGANETVIETVNFDNLSDVDSQDFINELEKKDRKVSLLKLSFWLGIILLLANTIYFFFPYDYKSESGLVANVKSNVVNIRAESNTTSLVVTQVKKQDRLIVLNDSIGNNWLLVEANNLIGYIYAPLVEKKMEILSEDPLIRFTESEMLAYISFSLILVLWIFSLIKTSQLDKKRKTVEIYYELDDEMNDIYEQFLGSFKKFLGVKRVWQMKTSSSGHDKKYHGGASTLVKRDLVTDFSLNKLPMRYFKTNASIPYIGLSNLKLYFLPERLLIKKDSRYASVMYKNLRLSANDSSFVESGLVASDSDIIDYTWRYVNKQGGPDKRFSNNKKIPVCLYSNYYFESEQGLQEIIQTSKNRGFDSFMEILNEIGSKQENFHKHGQVSDPKKVTLTLIDNLFDLLKYETQVEFEHIYDSLNVSPELLKELMSMLFEFKILEPITKSEYSINHPNLNKFSDKVREYYG